MSYSMPSEVMYGSIPVSTKTALGKELWSHERKPDYRPEANPYPKMLYKAYKDDKTMEVKCLDVHPQPFYYANQDMFRMACEAVDNFNLKCQTTVMNAQEHAEKTAQGWCEGPTEAIAAIRKQELEFAHIASEEAYKRQKMSKKAQAEWDEEEAKTPSVIIDIPEKKTEKKVHWKTAQKLAKEAEKASV